MSTQSVVAPVAAFVPADSPLRCIILAFAGMSQGDPLHTFRPAVDEPEWNPPWWATLWAHLKHRSDAYDVPVDQIRVLVSKAAGRLHPRHSGVWLPSDTRCVQVVIADKELIEPAKQLLKSLLPRDEDIHMTAGTTPGTVMLTGYWYRGVGCPMGGIPRSTRR